MVEVCVCHSAVVMCCLVVCATVHHIYAHPCMIWPIDGNRGSRHAVRQKDFIIEFY